MAKKTPETETPKTATLRISAKREGFRRAGRAWSIDPVEIAADTFSPDDLAALLAEPMLTVEEVAG